MDSESETSKKKRETKFFGITISAEFSGLFHKYYDRFLLDDSISDKDAVLLTIDLIEKKNSKAGVLYSECKKLFVWLGRREQNFHVNIGRCIRESLVERKDDTIYFLVGGIKRIRHILGQIGKAPVYMIKSGQYFTSIKLLEEFLLVEVNSEELDLCDTYISASTLFPFSDLKGKINSLKILTSNVVDPDKFKDRLNRMKREMGIVVEVKINNKIHDRYLISGEKCWTFGTSIKDLGNKDTIIREVSEVVSSLRDVFMERWSEARAVC